MFETVLNFFAGPWATVTESDFKKWSSNRNPFSRYLPYLAYDEEQELYFNTDETVGMLFKCTPVGGISREVIDGIMGLLDLVPVKGVLSVSLISLPYIDPALDQFTRLKSVRGKDNPLVMEAAESYATFLRESVQGGISQMMGTPLRDLQLIVSFKAPESLEGVDFRELKVSIREALKGAHLNPSNLGAQELIRLMFLVFNGRYPENLYWERDLSLSSHMILSESRVSVEWDQIRIGENFFRCVTPKQVAPEVSLETTACLTGLLRGPIDDANQITSHFFYTIVIINDPLIANRLRAKAALFMKQQKEGGDSILWRTMKEYCEEHVDAVNGMERGERYFYVMPVLWLWSDDAVKTKKSLHKAMRLFSSQGFTAQEDQGILAPLFLSSLPFGFYNEKNNTGDLERYFYAPSGAAAALMPVAGDYRGGGSPHMVLISRKGQLIFFDPFDDNATNKNIAVMGTTGGGKSFALNLYAFSMFASGATVRIVDLGYSYQKLCTLLGGQYIDLKLEEPLCMNPYSWIPEGHALGDAEDRERMLHTIADIVSCMCYAKTETEPTETEFNLIKCAVKWAWQEFGQHGDINRVYEYLAKFPSRAGDEIEGICDDGEKNECLLDLRTRAQNLAFNLTDWIAGGSFEKWFNGRANIDLVSSPFIVFELEKIRRIKSLFRAVALAVLDTTTSSFYMMDRAVPKVLIFEECGVTLKGNRFFKDVVEEAYRRGRKNNVSTATVFQSPLDLKSLGPLGDVILSNAQFRMYLPSDSYADAVREGVLDVSKDAIPLLESITSMRPRYGEVGIQSPYGLGVGRICVNGFLYYLCTSDAKDWQEIEREKQAHDGDLVAAIRKLAAKRDARMLRLLEHA